jgi:hypothetical protein
VVKKGYSYTSTPTGRTACTEPQYLYKGALKLYVYCVAWQVETTDHEMIPRHLGVSGAVRESAVTGGSTGQLLVRATDSPIIQTDNIKHGELRTVNECDVSTLSGWVVSHEILRTASVAFVSGIISWSVDSFYKNFGAD